MYCCIERGITFGKADYSLNLFDIPVFTFLIKSALFFALNGSIPNIKRYMQTPTENISL
jgi:hypothetical protein